MNERTRRDFLCAAAAAAAATAAAETGTDTILGADQKPASLAGVIGITTGGLNYQREHQILTLMTLPRFVRDQLGMQLIDIKRCFDIAWRAGFRGPWAIEHWNEDTESFARETVYLRDKLQQWMSDAE